MKKIKILRGGYLHFDRQCRALPPLDFFLSIYGWMGVACLNRHGLGRGRLSLHAHHRHVAGFIATAMPTAMASVIAPLMATNAACLIAWIMSLSPGACIGQRLLFDAMNELYQVASVVSTI